LLSFDAADAADAAVVVVDVDDEKREDMNLLNPVCGDSIPGSARRRGGVQW
jgi:hypothetical protein